MNEFGLYTLTVRNSWDPIKDKNFWEATIEIPDCCSLFNFHLFIQKIIDFDNDHLFEFYVGRNFRDRKMNFSENPGYPHDGGEYEHITLKDVYPLKGLKLYYLFDLGDNWIFEMRKSRKTAKAEKGKEYPCVVTDNGVKLIQYNYSDDFDLEFIE